MLHIRDLGFRVLGDESTHAIDIHNLLADGSVTEFVYPNGQAYHSFVALLLQVLGLDYTAMNVLSPLIASITLMVVVLALSVIYRGEWGGGVGIVGVGAGLFSFSGFIVMQSETSHKAFIFTLVILSYLLTWRVYRGDTDKRHIVLLLGILAAIPFFNALWGAIYTMLFTVLLLATGRITRPVHKLSKPVQIGFLIPPIVTWGIIAYYRHVNNAIPFIFARLRSALGGSESVSTSSTEAGGFIAGWPTITIADMTFSAWFLYTIGIFLIGLFTAVSFVIALSRLLPTREPRPIEKLIVFTQPLLGMILIALAAAGDLPTFRRLLVIPGMLGLLYWLGWTTTIEFQRRVTPHNVFLGLTIFLLGTSAFLALPRAMLDGNGAPYDFYADESDLQRVDWHLSYAGENCPTTMHSQDSNLAAQLAGHQGVTVPPPDQVRSIVYDAGRGSRLFC